MKQLFNFMGDNANLMLNIKAEDLMEANKALILQTLEEAKGRDDALISRTDFMKMYNVSSTTLWRWEQIGYLVPLKLGTKVYYRQTDVRRIMETKDKADGAR